MPYNERQPTDKTAWSFHDANDKYYHGVVGRPCGTRYIYTHLYMPRGTAQLLLPEVLSRQCSVDWPSS